MDCTVHCIVYGGVRHWSLRYMHAAEVDGVSTCFFYARERQGLADERSNF